MPKATTPAAASVETVADARRPAEPDAARASDGTPAAAAETPPVHAVLTAALDPGDGRTLLPGHVVAGAPDAIAALVEAERARPATADDVAVAGSLVAQL